MITYTDTMKKSPIIKLFAKDILVASLLAFGVLGIAYQLIDENFSFIYLVAFAGSLIGAVFIRTK